MEDFDTFDKKVFEHKLKELNFENQRTNEIVELTWYKLSFDIAKKISDKKDFELLKKRAKDIPNPWVKLITMLFTKRDTGKIRKAHFFSVRPYILGYGCDGTTDCNIHAIASVVAERNGLDYLQIKNRVYPDENIKIDWSKDEVVMQETIIPDKIDLELLLSDLSDINNRNLATEFGIELFKVGATKINYLDLKRQQEEIYNLYKKE